jgi:hypothetical protein
MTEHLYLSGVLQQQELPARELTTLRATRDEIERKLRGVFGYAPRFYYGGSYGKDTLIREKYDLDLVMYFPPDATTSIQDLFNSVWAALQRVGYIVQPKTVAIRLPYQGGFHVDVVPGRAQDASYRYATLYKYGQGSTLQTSLKVHIDAVRKSNLRDVLRLMKVWRVRQQLTLSTFAMELTVVRALHGSIIVDYGRALRQVFSFIRDQFSTVRLVDPANTNNVIEIDTVTRYAIQFAASRAAASTSLNEVIW